MKETPVVYLAGPMKGLTKAAMLGWRLLAAQKLAPIITLSPLRGFEHLLLDNGQMHPEYSDHPLRSLPAFISRDFSDVERSNALLVNFLGAQRVSIGTVMEIRDAWRQGKMIAVAMEPGNPHDHGMIRYPAMVCPTLDEAIEYLKIAFAPYL
jgi:hypothetical protein